MTDFITVGVWRLSGNDILEIGGTLEGIYDRLCQDPDCVAKHGDDLLNMSICIATLRGRFFGP